MSIQRRLRESFLRLCSSLVIFTQSSIYACTGIVSKAENGDCVFARTMEFGVDILVLQLALCTQRHCLHLANLQRSNGRCVENQICACGFNPTGNPILIDGVNEKGLACGGFYFPGWTQYEKVTQSELPNTVANTDFISWVLGNFASVREVKEALKNTKVAGVIFADWGVIPPIHYIVVDETGDKIVIEYVDGKQKIYDAWIGTITNAPTYDWHLTNARNYIGLAALNQPVVTINGHELAQFGQGSGALGLPGDFTPPSRFIRATFLNQVVLPGKSAKKRSREPLKS